jgi:hypothetical protein
MILPRLLLDVDGALLIDPAHIARPREEVIKYYGLEAVKPDIDVICWTLSELRRSNKFKRTRLCLVDCRYVFSTLYGHTLWRLRESSK